MGRTFEAEVQEEIARLGLARPVPGDASADEDPRVFLWWLLRMSVPTRRRAVEPLPPVDPALLARFEALLARRPAEEAAHGQLHADAASAIRRAEIVRDLRPDGSTVLAVGDDDGVTLALALLGVVGLAAIDVDERLLAWLDESARELGATLDLARVDVFDDPVPAHLAGRCAVVVTDPARSREDCEAFLAFAAACLVPGPNGRVVWADHPDWNFEHDEVMALLPSLGLRCVDVIEDAQSYPMTPAWLPDVDAKARELGVEPGWLAELLSTVRGWTHLYVLARRPTAQ